MSKLLLFEPIYGNGWFAMPSGESRETPNPFAIELSESDSMAGYVTMIDHEFARGSVSFAHRHEGSSEVVNVEVSRRGRVISLGYAVIAGG